MRIPTKAYLLSTVSCLALAMPAGAADIPVKAPVAVVVSTWAGPYIGINAGAAWHRWDFTDVDNQLGLIGGPGVGLGTIVNNTFWSQTRAAFTAGGQVGYNWQSGRLVYGVEADINWVNGRNSITLPSLSGGGGATATATTNFDWFATIRGRFGMTMSPTLVYVTGGVAIVHYRDTLTASFFPAGTDTISDRTRATWVAGGGIEHRLSSAWSVKAEGLVIGSTTENASTQRFGNNTYRSQFRHSAVIARIGINRRFLTSD